MITLASAKDHEKVFEASLDWEASDLAPMLLLFVGEEDLSERLESGQYGQDLAPITLDGTLSGVLPLRLEGGPVRVEVEVGGVLVPGLRGFVSIPEEGDDRASTRQLASSAGALLSRVKLRQVVEYPGNTPEYVVRDALYRLPYERGLVYVESVGTPILNFVLDGGFTEEQSPQDILSRVEEQAPYSFRDTAYGGHVAEVSLGLGRAPEPFFVYDSSELLAWKRPARAMEQYAYVEVFRKNPDGSDAYRQTAEVDYPGVDYPPFAGLTLSVPFDDETGDGPRRAQQHANDLALAHGRGLYSSDPTLPYMPLLERNDAFGVRDVSEDDDGFWERVWLHRVDKFQHPFSRGLETKTSCQATVRDEQRVKAPTLVLAAFSPGVLRTLGPPVGRDSGGLWFETNVAAVWKGKDEFGRWVDPALSNGLAGRDEFGRFREV